MGHLGGGQHLCPLCGSEDPHLQAEHIVDHHKRDLNLDLDYTEGAVDVKNYRLGYLNLACCMFTFLKFSRLYFSSCICSVLLSNGWYMQCVIIYRKELMTLVHSGYHNLTYRILDLMEVFVSPVA